MELERRQQRYQPQASRAMRSVVNIEQATWHTGLMHTTIANCLSQLRCVSLSEPCVDSCRWDVFVRTITGFAQPVERRASARDRPRLLQRCTRGSCSLANQAVHASIESIGLTAPSIKCCTDLPATPIHARPGPLPGHLPPIEETSLGHIVENLPQRSEGPPVSTDPSTSRSPSPPIKVLIG